MTHRFRPPAIFLVGSLVWKAEARTNAGKLSVGTSMPWHPA
jgi:hypothetical protein